MRSVRVVVNTAEERRRRILADHLDEQVRATGVLVDEVCHVMDEAGDEDEGTLLGLLLDCEIAGQHEAMISGRRVQGKYCEAEKKLGTYKNPS